MAIVKITKGYQTFVDQDDLPVVSRHAWHYANGYAYSTQNGQTIALHRFLMGLPVKGRSIQVDHIDGNKLNNSRSNLRVCNHSQNEANKKKKSNCLSKYKGVTLVYGKYWKAQIRVNGTNKSLGNFKTEDQAALAYNLAAISKFKEFALLNVIECVNVEKEIK